MSDYIVVINGKPSGPYPLADLATLNIKPGTFVKSRGMDDYKEAHEIPELRTLLGIKHQVSMPQYFASMDQRLLAVIIDLFLMFLLYILLASLIVMMVEEKQLRIIISVGGLALIPVLKFFYAVIMEASSRQATVGKVLLGLKVTDEKGLKIGFLISLARNLAKILSLGTLGLGYLLGFFDKKQQCLHDRIAGSLVIRDRLI